MSTTTTTANIPTKLPSPTMITLLGLLLRWCVSLHPYSGQGNPPTYGDMEAQRHWQEITHNLPLTHWYQNTSQNDLQYWGLDYPPLTAYHSYLCAMAAEVIEPQSIVLQESRGYETERHKLFMRGTVLLADLLVYFPAAYFLMRAMARHRAGQSEFMALVLYPGLILVDHGHFQYNCASLGLFVMAAAAVIVGRDCIGAILFCLALNYKQMELYHALPFFFYFFGLCFRQGGVIRGVWKLIKLGTCVIFTFSAVWLPFASDAAVLGQAVNRLFPWDRGLYEDKVASVWCSMAVFIKVNMMDKMNMAFVCLVSTLIGVLPSSLHLLAHPSPKHFRYALVNASLIFFLLSFHVHEKTILLAAVPVCLLISEEPFMASWFLTVSTASLLPLMIKDGLAIPTLALSAFFITLAHQYILPTTHKTQQKKVSSMWVWMRRTYILSLMGLTFLSVANLFVTPPPNLPDLFPLLLAVYCCGHFVFFCGYFHLCQFSIKYAASTSGSSNNNKNKVKVN